MQTVPDTIERVVTFPVPRERVWDAITNPEQISRWFGTHTEIDQLTAGADIVFAWGEHVGRGRIEMVDPPHQFAYRWEAGHPNLGIPFDELPNTLVTFVLDEVAEGTRLTLIESGFASLPQELGAYQLKENTSGWDAELKDLEQYLTQVG